MLRVLYLDYRSFDDECWVKHYDLLSKLRQDHGCRYSESGWQEFRDRVLAFMETTPDYYRFVVLDSERIMAWAEVRIRHAGTDLQGAYFLYDGLFDKVPRELASTIGTEVARYLEQYTLSSAFSMLSSQRLADMPRLWGGTELNRIDRFLLKREKANREVIERWLEKYPRENPNLRLEFCKTIPERHLERYAATFTDFLREMPDSSNRGMPFLMDAEDVRKQEKLRNKSNSYVYTYLLLDQDDALLGHTNGFISGADPKDVYQAMTGVVSDYRGRGLSKWLKASLFMKIGEEFPENEIFTTDMRAANAPIQAVNTQMGYELDCQGSEFEIGLESLQAFLADY